MFEEISDESSTLDVLYIEMEDAEGTLSGDDFLLYLHGLTWRPVVMLAVITKVADRLIEKDRWTGVKILVEEADRRQFDHPILSDIRAKLYIYLGLKQEAIKCLTFAINKHDRDYLRNLLRGLKDG